MKSFRKGIKTTLFGGRHVVKSKPSTDQDGNIIDITEFSLMDDDKLFYPSTSSLFSPDGCITSEKYFFPEITRNQAEIMLLSPNLQNNTFLVRNSTRPNHYAISVRSDNRVLHLLIQHDVDEGMFFLKVDKKFPTIQRLVENYCHKTEDSYVFLLENTSKEKLQMKTEFNDESELCFSLICSPQTINPTLSVENKKLIVTISSSKETVVSTPLSICAVIDLSDSMEDYLPVLKDTLTTLVGRLRPCDKLSLISFANQAKLELDLIPIDDNGKTRANQVISQLRVWGLTNLSAGLRIALNVLAKNSPNDATPTESILVFTDGEANVGCNSYTEMAQYVEEVIRRIKTESMRVCNISRHITASVIAFSTAPPVELKQISDAGNGLYFPTHLTEDRDSRDDIPNAFAKFFGFATTVAAKDIHLSIIADPQVRLCYPLNLPSIYKLSNMTGSGCTLDIHDIQAGNTISIAFPINFKEKLDATNRQCKQLATATMQAHSFVTRRQVLLESVGEVFVDPMRDAINLENPEAYLHTLRGEVIQTLELVYKTANNRRFDDAISQVKNMVHILIGASLSEEEVVQCLVETLIVVLDDLKSPKGYMKRGAKILNQLIQAHTQQVNNVPGTIMIPSDEQILGELGVDFELREFVKLSIYEGAGCMAEKLFISNYANIQPDYPKSSH